MGYFRMGKLSLYFLDAGEEYFETLKQGEESPTNSFNWIVSQVAGRKPYTISESWKLNGERELRRAQGLAHWNATKELTGTGRPVDAIISPMAAYAAPPHGKNRCVHYGTILEDQFG